MWGPSQHQGSFVAVMLLAFCLCTNRDEHEVCAAFLAQPDVPTQPETCVLEAVYTSFPVADMFCQLLLDLLVVSLFESAVTCIR